VVKLKICITDIGDLLTLGQNEAVSSILSNAKKLVENGGIVVIERCYSNEPPVPADILVTYETLDDIKNWREKLNEVQKILDRPEVN